MELIVLVPEFSHLLCSGDNLHEMSKPVLWEIKKKCYKFVELA